MGGMDQREVYLEIPSQEKYPQTTETYLVISNSWISRKINESLKDFVVNVH